MKKKILAGLLAVVLSFSLAACGNKEEDKEETSAPLTDEEEIEEEEEELEDNDSFEYDSEDETSTEFEIPVQEDFVRVDGLSDNYADMDNISFAYDGTVFTLGESTLKDMIDGGIPFDENELNNKGNNVNSNYETNSYTVYINDYVTMQFRFVNIAEESVTEEECLLSSVRYYYLYVPQPDYDADFNAEITEGILDGAKNVCFSFPATLMREELLENNNAPSEQGDDYVNYYIDSEVYIGSIGYHFEFNEITDQLEAVSMCWLP